MKFVIIGIFTLLILNSCSNSTNSVNDGTGQDADTQAVIDSDKITGDNNTVKDADTQTAGDNDKAVSDEDTIIDDSSEGSVDDSDAGVLFTEPKNGRIWVFEQVSDQAGDLFVGADIYDKPVRFDAFSPIPASMYKTIISKSGCTLYKAGLNACNPPCGTEEFCNSDSKCEKGALRVSAGIIKVSDPYTSAELTMSSMGDYSSYTPTTMPVKGFNEAAEFKASAAGDKMEKFDVSVNAPHSGKINVDFNIQLYDDKNTEISWVKNGNADEKIVVVLNFGWHGAPPEATVICEAGDSAEKIVIDKEISKQTPINGGAGLFPHSSYVFRMKQKVITVSDKTIEFVTGYQNSCNALHE